VALELPEAVVCALDGWAQAAVASREELRRVPAASLHVTLCFLGHRPAAEVDAIGAAVASVAAPVADLRLAAPAWLPPRRPRVLAADLDDPGGASVALQAALSADLAALGVYTPERRPFRPHVTVARVRQGRRARAGPLGPLPGAGAPFAAAALTLFRSRLSPRGASYEPLVRLALQRPR
jgi:2'-5' RNA ligase